MRLKKRITISVLSIIFLRQILCDSISERDANYIAICNSAVENDLVFSQFRSNNVYRGIVECSEDFGFLFFNEIIKIFPKEEYSKINICEKLDTIGNPPKQLYEFFGCFSATTLRYILVGYSVKKMFALSNKSHITEIGIGFGGQAYILSVLESFASYHVVDLPIVEKLAKKTFDVLQVANITYNSMDEACSQEKIDLVISNYAFSECDKTTQMAYFDKFIIPASHGYFIYNNICDLFNVNSLSLNEFVSLLKLYGKNPIILDEIIQTAVIDTMHLNKIVVW